MEVNIHEAKTHLSKLLERVASGEEVIIAKAGKPVARIVGIKPKRAPRPSVQEKETSSSRTTLTILCLILKRIFIDEGSARYPSLLVACLARIRGFLIVHGVFSQTLTIMCFSALLVSGKSS